MARNRRPSRPLNFPEPKKRPAPKSAEEDAELEIDLALPGTEVEFKPKRRAEIVVSTGVILTIAILMFFFALVMLCMPIYFSALDEAEPLQKIEHLEKIILWTLGAIGGAFTAVLGFLFKKRRRR